MSQLEEHVTWPPPGSYVVATSGGVDSAVLLDLMAGHDEYRLVAAHFNHGWSETSSQFEQVARAQAARAGVTFVTDAATVPRNEAAARAARYGFVERVRQEAGADAIVTAHHADDLVETVALHLERGTGRRGLAPFRQGHVVRPLIELYKDELITYAKTKALDWIEDPSNTDQSLRRNKLRHTTLPVRLAGNPALKQEVAALSKVAALLNQQIDEGLSRLFTTEENRAYVSVMSARSLDVAVLSELLLCMVYAVWPAAQLDRRTIEALAVDIKTGRLRRSRHLSHSLSAGISHGIVSIVFIAKEMP